MAISLDEAAAVLRQAMRETVKRYSFWYLIQGVLLVVAGVLAFVYPLIASVAIIVLLAWILIISGVLQGIGLIGARHVPHFWLQAISAVLAILIGLLLLRAPGSGLLVITVLLIVFFMVEGIAKVIFALTIKPFPNWGWVLGSGVVSIFLAVILWANMPLSADWLLGVLLGIQLMCEGAALTYLAWQVRTAPAVST
ncbi:MAG TPA: HdeD family acid-resistance protein [Methyloceanibacter sp.]|nr:HdeD family acid-resistance protein [Methyloceanibacter sp.]